MSSNYFFLLSLLPSLPPVGEKPPLTIEEVFKLSGMEDDRVIRKISDAVAAEDLIKNQIAAAHGYASEQDEKSPIRDSGVPESLGHLLQSPPDAQALPKWVTQVWRNYYLYLEEVGRSAGSELVAEYARFEYSLKNTLFKTRTEHSPFGDSEQIDKRDSDSVADFENCCSSFDHNLLVGAWKSQPDPMASEKLLDEARISFIEGKSGYFSFSIDEFAAYLLKLRIITRHSLFDVTKGEKILQEVIVL